MRKKRAETDAKTPDLPTPKLRNLGIRKVRVADLEDAPWNFREHPEAQRAALEGAVNEIGWYGYPDVYETPEGQLRITDGHLRKDLLLAKYGPDAQIDVNVTDFTEAEAKIATLTKDPLAAMAVTNAEALAILIGQAKMADEALKKMVTSLAEANPVGGGGNAGLSDPDDIPEPPDAAVTQPGDLWILGNHRLLCGDSSLPPALDRLLDRAPIHLVNTDPPYNVKVEPRSNNAIAAGLSSFQAAKPTHHQGFDLARDAQKATPTGKMRPKDRPLINDFVSREEFDRLLAAWFGNVTRVLLPGRGFYIWGGYANMANYPPVLEAHELYVSQTVIWDKQWPVLTRKDFMGAHEWCFYGWKLGAAHQFYGPNNATDLWAIKKVTPQSMIHLTEKPVALAARSIEYSSKPGENVLDLFGGSGSTMIAAEQTGRHAFLMELDQLYCDVIVTRWEAFTGKKAERQAAGPCANDVAPGGVVEAPGDG